jgi:hypothetical protein
MQSRPKTSAGDVGYGAAKAVLGMIPYAGAAAAELFSLVLAPPLTRRRDEWIESIAQALSALETQVEGFRIENLSKDERFITAVLCATQSAIRTHQREKLEALRSAVLNVALRGEADENVELVFLSIADSFTEWHLRILRYFDEHPTQSESGYRSGHLVVIYPSLQAQEEFYEQIVRDLYAHGFVVSNVTPGTATAFMPYAGRTTEFGKKFLAFIASPLR